MKHTKEHQKEKQWWLSLAYALGRLRVRSPAPLEKTRGFGMTPTGRSVRCFFKLTHHRAASVLERDSECVKRVLTVLNRCGKLKFLGGSSANRKRTRHTTRPPLTNLRPTP